MTGITVIVVPTWAVWAFIALGVANIATAIYAAWLKRKLAKAAGEPR